MNQPTCVYSGSIFSSERQADAAEPTLTDLIVNGPIGHDGKLTVCWPLSMLGKTFSAYLIHVDPREVSRDGKVQPIVLSLRHVREGGSVDPRFRATGEVEIQQWTYDPLAGFGEHEDLRLGRCHAWMPEGRPLFNEVGVVLAFEGAPGQLVSAVLHGKMTKEFTER